MMARLRNEDINEIKAKVCQQDSTCESPYFYDETFVDRIAAYWDWMTKDEQLATVLEASSGFADGTAKALAELLRSAISGRVVKTPDSELAADDSDKSLEVEHKHSQSPKSAALTPPTELGKSPIELLEAIKAIDEPIVDVKPCQSLASAFTSLVHDLSFSLPKIRSIMSSEISKKFLNGQLFVGPKVQIDPFWYKDLGKILKENLGRVQAPQKEVLTHIIVSSPPNRESLRSPHSEKDEKLTSQTQESADDDPIERVGRLVTQLEVNLFILSLLFENSLINKFNKTQVMTMGQFNPSAMLWSHFFQQPQDPGMISILNSNTNITRTGKQSNLPPEVSRYLNLRRRLKGFEPLDFVDTQEDYILMAGLKESCTNKSFHPNIKSPPEEALQEKFKKTVEAFNKTANFTSPRKKNNGNYQNSGHGTPGSDHYSNNNNGHSGFPRKPGNGNGHQQGGRYQNNRQPNMNNQWNQREMPMGLHGSGAPLNFPGLHPGLKYFPHGQPGYMGSPIPVQQNQRYANSKKK